MFARKSQLMKNSSMVCILSRKIFVMLAIMGFGTSAHAQVPFTQNCEPEWISNFLPTDDMRDVVLVGNVAYVASSSAGLQIFDVSDATAPVLLGAYDTPGNAVGLDVLGATAYVADELAGMQIIDISNSAAPVLLGTYDTPGSAQDIALEGTKAYIADASGGFHIVDVSNPASPSLLGTRNTAALALSLDVVGTTLYLVQDSFGLSTFDVSDPQAIFSYSTFAINGVSRSVEVQNGYAYFITTASTGTLYIMDVSNPSLLDLVKVFIIGDKPRKLDIEGNRLYTTFENKGLIIFDISDPLNVTELYRMVSGTTIRGVGVSNGNVVTTDLTMGLRTTDFFMTPNSKIGDITSTTAITRAGDTAYWAQPNEIVAWDMSSPSTPTLLGSVTTTFDPTELVINGTLMFALSPNGIMTIDISDPTSMIEIHTLSTSGLFHQDLTFSGSRAVTWALHPDNVRYLHIFDLSASGVFTEIRTYPIFENFIDIELFSTILYVSRISPKLTIVLDLTDTFNIVQTVTFVIARAARFYTFGEITFSFDSTPNGIRYYDMTDPANPVPLSTLPNVAGAVSLVGDIVFVKNQDRVEIFDISDPTNPLWVGAECFDAITFDSFVAGTTYALASGYPDGIGKLDLSHLGSLFSPPGDLNSDGIVDGADLGIMLGDWGTVGPSPSDLNSDGIVDGADLGILLGSWSI
jgi:hypothetical protein